MNWKIIDFHQRDMQTVAGKCSVRECRLGVYALSFNRKELLCYNASSWDDAMHCAEAKLLVRANEASSFELKWKNNWTALTPLGVLTVKLWGDSYMVKLVSKVIRNIEIIEMHTPHAIRMHAACAFKDLTENLAAELS